MSARKRLVVIGNGMAGARLVEDVVGRSGRDLYDITMFGDEPYGNYNRILLSNVLAKSQDPSDIFLNPLEWYAENGVTLHAGTRDTLGRPPSNKFQLTPTAASARPCGSWNGFSA